MALIIGLVVVVVILALVYNGLVQKQVSVKNGWSQIAVQLKRRHDLIPNLVETVKGYSQHEKDTLEKVVAARNQAVQATSGGSVADTSRAESALTGSLRQIFALAESYPDLKANQNFLQLQEEIASTENRIGFARQNYNDCVQRFNVAIRQIPGVFIAGFLKFEAAEFFEIDEAERQAVQQPPKVSFS